MEGTYFDVGPYPDRTKAITAYRTAMALGDYAAAAHNLGNRLVSRRQFAAAESAYVARIEHDPSVSAQTYQQLAIALIDQGKMDAADSIMRAIQAEHGPQFASSMIRSQALYNKGSGRLRQGRRRAVVVDARPGQSRGGPVLPVELQRARGPAR